MNSDLIRQASWLVAVVSSFATAAALYIESNDLILTGAALMAFLGWLGVVLSAWVNPWLLTHIVVFGTLGVSIYGVIAFGSVRTSGSVLFVAAVAAAGTFLGKRALIASVVISVASLGLLNFAENLNYLQPKSLKVGFFTWYVHTSVLIVVAGLVYYAKTQSRRAFSKQRRALEENEQLALERDQNLARFTRIFRNNPSPMITQSAETGLILDVNPAFERCYGYKRDEIIGQSDRILWAQSEQRRVYNQQLAQHKRVALVKVDGLRADGTVFDAQISSEWSDEREDSLIITNIADITAQTTAVERLQRSEERFAKAFNFSPLKLIITRLSDDTVVEVSQGERLGIPSGLEIRGGPASSAGPWFSASDRDLFVRRLLKEGHLANYATRLTRPDGNTIDAKVWAEQIDIDGDPCMLTCIVDTTEEKRRNDLLRDIAKGMTGHTAQAFFYTLTQRMASALGADIVLIGEITPDQHVNTLSVFKEGCSIDNFRIPIEGSVCEDSLGQRELSVYPSGLSSDPRCGGVLRDAAIDAAMCQPLHNADGHAIGMLSALWTHPITANEEVLALMAIFASRAQAELMRLHSERALAQLNSTLEVRVLERTAELSKLNAELDSFAYSISHDLKSPLRAIDGFTQLLDERLHDRLDEEEQLLMQRVLGATHRMATLMADLLALARVSQLPLHEERLNLSVMAADELKRCLEKAPRPQLRSHIELGLIAHADARLAQVVLKNLLENAVKYTRDQAEPLIEIGRVPSPPEAAPEFFVRDNGAGFSMEHAHKLFKPFQRLHMPSAGFEGTGIGLATVRRIVERHGGTINATATPGQGAEFRFSLKRLSNPSIPTP